VGGRLRTRERTAVERSQRSAFASQRGDFVAEEHANAEQEGWKGLYCQGGDCCES
jgi:hypothetical protein